MLTFDSTKYSLPSVEDKALGRGTNYESPYILFVSELGDERTDLKHGPVS
jgi:hypothetical protein